MLVFLGNIGNLVAFFVQNCFLGGKKVANATKNQFKKRLEGGAGEESATL